MEGIALAMSKAQNTPITRQQVDEITEARTHGAMFHLTNSSDNWYCIYCGVFGKGGTKCWCCGSKDVKMKWLPRWGGGAQHQMFEGEE